MVFIHDSDFTLYKAKKDRDLETIREATEYVEKRTEEVKQFFESSKNLPSTPDNQRLQMEMHVTKEYLRFFVERTILLEAEVRRCHSLREVEHYEDAISKCIEAERGLALRAMSFHPIGNLVRTAEQAGSLYRNCEAMGRNTQKARKARLQLYALEDEIKEILNKHKKIEDTAEELVQKRKIDTLKDEITLLEKEHPERYDGKQTKLIKEEPLLNLEQEEPAIGLPGGQTPSNIEKYLGLEKEEDE